MRLTSKLLSLPASILFLITTHTAAALPDDPFTNNSPGHSRPHAETVDQRDVNARNEQTPLRRNPVGIMKMSDDPSQKFYMHYWGYEDDLPQTNGPDDDPMVSLLRTRDEEEANLLLANSSAIISYRAPFALHTEENFALHQLEARGRIPSRDAAAGALAALQKRQFKCPTGTSDCSAIGYTNSCCGTDETCFQIEDTGLGPVGCCLNGDTCGGTISACNAPNTPCDKSQGGSFEGGGCCIPDYVCAGVGCVPLSSSSTVANGGGGASTLTTTVEVPPLTSTTSRRTTTTKSTTSQSSSSSHASIVTATVTVTASGVAPARPTGSSGSADSTSVTTPATTEAPGSCPTGFYACEAYHAGGCCRTGRDCATTDCPVASSTTLVSSGVTIVAPVGPGATLASSSGACASGWSSCAASLGGNCCLSGYECGTASCTSISPTNTLVGDKSSPSSGMRSVQASLELLIVALIIAIM